MRQKILQALKQAAGRRNLETSPAILDLYGGDASKRNQAPMAVVRASSTEQVARVMACCYDHGLAVVPRGAGSGFSGGAVAVAGGIVLDLGGLLDLQVMPQDRLIKAGAGVLLDELKQAADQAGFFFPPDPSSAAFATLGGAMAENAGGLRTVKYGVTGDYVLGLTCVLMDGRIMRLGGQTTKSVVGYNLTRLLVGSEGTLAVMVEATLRLIPKPEAICAINAGFASINEAIAAIKQLNAQAIVPTALEFIDSRTLDAVRLGGVEVPDKVKAMLLVEVDGAPEVVRRQGDDLQRLMLKQGGFNLQRADSPEQATQVWQLRRGMSQAMYRLGKRKLNQDVALPLGRLEQLMPELERMDKEFGVNIVTFGHAGDGNLHVNIMYDDAKADKAAAAVSQLFAHILHLGGSVSGEHGVGLSKLAAASLEVDEPALDIMWQIKKVFDPAGLLNPGKALPRRG